MQSKSVSFPADSSTDLDRRIWGIHSESLKPGEGNISLKVDNSSAEIRGGVNAALEMEKLFRED